MWCGVPVKMNRFQIPSPILEIEMDSPNDFLHEYVTTVIPFEILTTEHVPETETIEHNELMIIIYGIGGVLVFFIVYSICYRCIMPEISDEQYARFLRRQRAIMDERIRFQNLERQRNQTDVENSENPPVNENVNTTETVTEDRRTRESQHVGQSTFRGIVGSASSAIRSHTVPKQVGESNENACRQSENRNTTVREEPQEHSKFPISEKYEERVPSWEYFPKHLNPGTELDQSYKEAMFIDESPCDKSDSHIAILHNSASVSQAHEGQSQSSPTSPNIVRRRYSSQETTPRRSSSMR